jgi:hypothetical protein
MLVHGCGRLIQALDKSGGICAPVDGAFQALFGPLHKFFSGIGDGLDL